MSDEWQAKILPSPCFVLATHSLLVTALSALDRRARTLLLDFRLARAARLGALRLRGPLFSSLALEPLSFGAISDVLCIHAGD